jgi:hypothetical protein
LGLPPSVLPRHVSNDGGWCYLGSCLKYERMGDGLNARWGVRACETSALPVLGERLPEGAAGRVPAQSELRLLVRLLVGLCSRNPVNSSPTTKIANSAKHTSDRLFVRKKSGLRDRPGGSALSEPC